jgi:glycosyltransferase involved in cell wall biosynthesis
MRLCLVIPGGLDPSGTARSIPALQWLVTRLAARHDVEVLSLRQGRRPCHYAVHGARVHDLGLAGHRRSTAGALALARAAAWMSGRTPFDVWHGVWLGMPSIIAALGAAHQRRPLVASVMGTELTPRPGLGVGSRLSRRVARWTLRRATQATAGSLFQARLVGAAGGGCSVVPLGVPREWFGESANGGNARLLHIGDSNRWKDQVTLLDALAQVRQHTPDAHLDIAGVDTLSGQIQRAAHARGLDAHITFHGHLGREALRDLCRRASLLVMSSRHEAQCVAVVEAAAFGVPTVGTRVGLIADGEGEWTRAVDVGDAAALAAAILELLGNDERRRALGQRARAWAAAHDADWTATQFEAIYADATTRHGRRERT